MAMLLKKKVHGPFDLVREVRSVGSVPEWRRCWNGCYEVVGGGGPGRGVRSGGPVRGAGGCGPGAQSWLPLAPHGAPSFLWPVRSLRPAPGRAGVGGLTQKRQRKHYK